MPDRIGRRAAGLALCAALAAGCGNPNIAKPAHRASLYVAFIDAKRAPMKWRDVPLHCEGPKGEIVSWNMHRDEAGLLFVENAPTARCWILGGFNGGPRDYVFKLADDPKRNLTAVEPKKPGVQYMGAYRFEPGLAGSFRLVKVDDPGEMEVLGSVLPYLLNTPWSDVVKKRLDYLDNQRNRGK